MKKQFIIYTILIIFFFGLIQYHEHLHYSDYQNLNCTNITRNLFSVSAYCENENYNIAREITTERDNNYLFALGLN